MSIEYDTLFTLNGKIIPIEIEYFSGWSFDKSQHKCEKLTKKLECFVIGKTSENNGVYVFFSEPQFLSWGNGPTLPFNIFVLKSNNEMAYCDKKLKVHNWTDYIPKWKLSVSS